MVVAYQDSRPILLLLREKRKRYSVSDSSHFLVVIVCLHPNGAMASSIFSINPLS